MTILLYGHSKLNHTKCNLQLYNKYNVVIRV